MVARDGIELEPNCGRERVERSETKWEAVGEILSGAKDLPVEDV